MSKPLSLNELRSRCNEFVIEWRDVAGDERQEAQSFVRDLLACFCITETRAALYEKRAPRTSTGGQGYIDALVPGQLLIEMKSAGKQLGLAEIQALEGSGLDDHDAGVFLVRTLFALYADDSGVWSRDLFLEFIETRTSTDGSNLGAQLVGLYQVMNQPHECPSGQLDEILAQFPYVNGGIFSNSIAIPYFRKQARDLLLRACAFDWREISPAIFGSLFQAVKSPEARRNLGEHYTTETNILKTLAPLFLDELHEKFEAARHDTAGLKKLRTELGEIRVLETFMPRWILTRANYDLAA